MSGRSARAASGAVRGAAIAAASALTTAALTGCALLPSEQYGPDDWPALANGIDAEIATVELRSFLIISTDEGEPGRFLGTIVNNSDDQASVVFADDDEEVTIAVPGREFYNFSENQDGFETVAEIPGARLAMTVTVGSETEEVIPIILDGSLEQYRQFLPSETG